MDIFESFGDTLMSMLKSKPLVIESILRDLESCQKNMEAFEKLERLYANGGSVNIDKAMTACAKSLRHTNDMNRKLLMLLLVYVSGTHYSSDVGTILNRMGRGHEALQEMFKQKMQGL